MSSDRLSPDHSALQPADISPDKAEQAVLGVLAGIPPHQCADHAGMEPTELATAVEVYQHAGRQALEVRTTAEGWWQLYVRFADWTAAEEIAADHLAPLLHRAEADGAVSAWWFIRKHPCWRMRLRIPAHSQDVQDRIGAALDDLSSAGHIRRWWTGIYESETAAFGNATGMRLAHELFTADSRAVLDLRHHRESPLGRRELSILLCSTLMRAAALEWYEQGDVWDLVARQRPLPDDAPPDRLRELSAGLRKLMLADTAPDGPLMGGDGPLTFAADWANAFHQAGQSLGVAARAGTLDRGLRQVLAYHVIFHWNRLGLPTRKQSVLASAARAAILGHPASRVHSGLVRQPLPKAPASAVADRVASRFPLVCRPHLTCPDLEARIAEARGYARASQGQVEQEAQVERACAAWNLAALIAADCGMPGLAADLCTHQFRILQAAWPVSGRTAIASLQPLVNLARLTHRAGDAEGAYQALHSLDHAVHHGGDAFVHGTSLSFDNFVESGADRREAARWLRALLREDSTRLLVATGQWAKAASHAAMYDDSGERLHEARQTRIIAHLQDDQADSALTLLEASTITEPWEQAVAAVLRCYIDQRTHRRTTEGATTALAAVRHARESRDPDTALFLLRLALIAADLTAGTSPGDAAALRTELIHDTAESEDAFAARELLRHKDTRTQMTRTDEQTLNILVRKAGLGRGAIPTTLLSDLVGAAEAAETTLVRILGPHRAFPKHGR
ncbi:thiopeptide-type bacteriocin biosynthesis protein [Streptomyces macrolidinus]|uniref:thiopeptide-type bacteriocin biosynthesis protein n=1 Tax=Streptomyces macrolidinus TaxID=2952607 RepID=UPI0027E38A11|nr:thiopeptide-type bacteriocin biosynthesis protein [Streptomyces macrolidinus]